MIYYEVEFRASDAEAPQVDSLLSCFREIYTNGGAIFKCFRPVDDAAFDSMYGFPHIDENFLIFLAEPSVRAAVPELWPEGEEEQDVSFRTMTAFEMEGLLTALLVAGGVYQQFTPTVEDARRLTRNFTEALFGDRFLSVWVATTGQRWTGWFHGILDTTIIALEPGSRTFWLFCLTDVD